jgi:hypothetical protein
LTPTASLAARPPILINAGASGRGWSRLDTALHCLRLYAYKYVEGGPKMPGSRAQTLGSLVHVGLAHYYARMGATYPGGINVAGELVTDPARIMTPHDAMAAVAEQLAAEGADVDLDAADACVDAYLNHYAAERLRVLHVEEVFAAKFWPSGTVGVGEPIDYTARLDLVFETRDGKVVVSDHKSTSRIEAKHARFYSMSGQLIGQRWLGQQVYGARFGGFLLNLIQTTAPYKFERPNLDSAPALLRAFPQTVLDAEERIAHMQAKGRPVDEWPAVMSETGCYGRYGMCPYAKRCQWGS